MPIHNGTFDLAFHGWHEPFERVMGLAAARGISLSTPRMGERLDLVAPHRGERWWQRAVENADVPKKAARRWFSCRKVRQAEL